MTYATIIDGGKGKPFLETNASGGIRITINPTDYDRIAALERRIAVLESEAAARMKFPDTRRAGSVMPDKYDGWKTP